MTEEETFSNGSETDRHEEDETASSERSASPILLTKEMAARAGFNVKSPIVKAVFKNLVELSSEATEPESVQKNCCSLCDVPCFTSESDRVSHILGKKHWNKMWSLRIIQNLNRMGNRKKVVNPTEGEYKCQLCQVTVNSPLQLVSHMRGTKHLNATTQTGVVLSARPLGDLSQPTVSYFCQHCKIFINSHKKVLKHKYSPLHKINMSRNYRVRKELLSYRCGQLEHICMSDFCFQNLLTIYFYFKCLVEVNCFVGSPKIRILFNKNSTKGFQSII